ncbi:CehA/McbA family metallohydrolase [Clostridium sp. NSJ-49]|uniref:CehA/McbA family metallohydrolase n=1 Tax=Clostridium TaxID=1485 RepID=UPI00164BDE80|nr:CehA/McbA family metallohydrolase [Clostridium sp. NSJ-49]MBC5625962.1 CehA/McbA family metallohydrolase [Clostridium sp. NSJ-49]MDU6340483.1 CehA/McbA family metallohydrolase [Clostridium sp.]
MGKKKSKNNIVFDQNKIRFYYGIPHCHSNYSTGRGTPTELYEYAAKCGLDYLFITDHNDFLNNKSSKDGSSTKWQSLISICNKFKKSHDDFLPVVGFECKTQSYGDFNVINSKNFFTGTLKDLRLLTLWMINNPTAFISINHPHKNIMDIPYDPIFNNIITSIEVCNGNPSAKITYHEKYFFQLLDCGWKLGAINGQDNHRVNFDESDNLTVYIGNELSKEALIDAFRMHRTYSTESRFLRLYFTINNNFMGESIVTNNKKLKFLIFAEDVKYRIKDIEIITNGGKLIKSINNINLNSIKYLYEHIPVENESWYVIKVYQSNGKIAITSPIFIYHYNIIDENTL